MPIKFILNLTLVLKAKKRLLEAVFKMPKKSLKKQAFFMWRCYRLIKALSVLTKGF